MARRSSMKSRIKAIGKPDPRDHHQKGSQPGSNTDKDAWKSNQENIDTQPGTGQEGQHPRKGEPWGSTPGEVRGHPGGKKGQAMGGKRGTMNTMKAKSIRASKKPAK